MALINPLELKQLKERAPLPAILGILMFFLPLYLVDPIKESLESTEKNLDSLLRSARQIVMNRGREIDKFEKYGMLQKKLARIESWIQPESYLPLVIERIHEISEIFSVKLLAIDYSFPKADFPQTRQVAMNMTIKADYLSVRAFLKALEGFPLPLFPTEILATEDGNFSLVLLHMIRPEK